MKLTLYKDRELVKVFLSDSCHDHHLPKDVQKDWAGYEGMTDSKNHALDQKR